MGYLNEDGLATLVGKVKGQVVQLTAAEYRQIPAETKNTDNKIYFVEDDDYAYAIDSEPTLDSENLVKSGGVYNYTSKIGTGALTTTAQTLIPAVNELKASVDTLNNDLTSHYVELGAESMSSSSGSVVSNSLVRVTYNKHTVTVDYYIRLQNPNGRPTITINGFPNLPITFISTGFPTHARIDSTNFITDSSIFRHTSGTTTATITFYYYLGDFPTGSGYVIAAGNVSWNY